MNNFPIVDYIRDKDVILIDLRKSVRTYCTIEFILWWDFYWNVSSNVIFHLQMWIKKNNLKETFLMSLNMSAFFKSWLSSLHIMQSLHQGNKKIRYFRSFVRFMEYFIRNRWPSLIFFNLIPPDPRTVVLSAIRI